MASIGTKRSITHSSFSKKNKELVSKTEGRGFESLRPCHYWWFLFFNRNEFVIATVRYFPYRQPTKPRILQSTSGAHIGRIIAESRHSRICYGWAFLNSRKAISSGIPHQAKAAINVIARMTATIRTQIGSFPAGFFATNTPPNVPISSEKTGAKKMNFGNTG